MKIVDRKTFLDMPRGTVFAKVEACNISPLMLMNGKMGDNDFGYREMIEVENSGSSEYLDMMLEVCDDKTRDTLPLDWDTDIHRDGLFDDNQMFAVLDDKELTLLIEMLTNARNLRNTEVTTLIAHTAQQMAESVDRVWEKLPEKPDIVCGHSEPEACRAYWYRLARISLAVITANEAKPE